MGVTVVVDWTGWDQFAVVDRVKRMLQTVPMAGEVLDARALHKSAQPPTTPPSVGGENQKANYYICQLINFSSTQRIPSTVLTYFNSASYIYSFVWRKNSDGWLSADELDTSQTFQIHKK
ncbi:hypothetical protein MAR_001698 [Mya arenaria]|uniref:Uncharacterized protein n=1 Tax=Mya arenaria TaxID=6604 RepID=A0ABY7FCN3_MYAAR|nr:hypothetical protein MAR_001698 [Mya arenaria]